MNHPLWKDNWEESRQHYLDWWDGKGLVISMWEHLRQRRRAARSGPPAAPGPRLEPILV